MNKKERKLNYQRLQDAKAVYLTRAEWKEDLVEEDDGGWIHNNLSNGLCIDDAVYLQEKWDRQTLAPKRVEPEFNYDTDQMDDGG